MEALLRQGLAAMGLPETAAPGLADYAGRMLRQNEVMNLTAITDPTDVAHHHLLDSAAVAQHVPLAGKRVRAADPHLHVPPSRRDGGLAGHRVP